MLSARARALFARLAARVKSASWSERRLSDVWQPSVPRVIADAIDTGV